MEYLPAYVKILAYLFVVVYMLSIPLETPRGEIVVTPVLLSLFFPQSRGGRCRSRG
jgi:hypothetical protein